MTWRATVLACAASLCFLGAWGLLTWWLWLQLAAVVSVCSPWHPPAGPVQPWHVLCTTGPIFVAGTLWLYIAALLAPGYLLTRLLTWVSTWAGLRSPDVAEEEGVYY